MCVATVVVLITSRSAMAVVPRPCPSSASTSCSRGLSPKGFESAGPFALFSINAARAMQRRTRARNSPGSNGFVT